MVTIKYIKHGKIKTGGARHEETLINLLEEKLQKESGSKFIFSRKSFPGIYKGIRNFILLLKGFISARADVNIVVVRLALSSLLRNFFNVKKTIIVIHHYDENDNKSAFLKIYFKALFYILANYNQRKVAIITVSPFFQDYFQNLFPELNIYLIPNFFNIKDYKENSTEKNPKKIYLGQFSHKNHNDVLKLAEKLTLAGYYCFFSTLYKQFAGKFQFYDVKKLDKPEYLNEIRSSYCTIAFPAINEGWNRVAHESLLLGTPVIGFAKGGLNDLLIESNSYIVKDYDEAFSLITNPGKITYTASNNFIEKYDIKNAYLYLNPLIEFIKK